MRLGEENSRRLVEGSQAQAEDSPAWGRSRSALAGRDGYRTASGPTHPAPIVVLYYLGCGIRP